MSRPIVVVGGGLAGLTCALRLARGGAPVRLLEGASTLGGRARTQHRSGFAVNLGPHALYRAGAARRVLEGLGIPVRGASPPTAALGLRDGALAGPLPFTPWAALTTPLLTAAERWEFARWFASAAVASPEPLRGTPVAAWLAPLSPAARRIALALVRVTTYTNAPDLLDAGATLAQVQRSLRGVDYLDGGWGRLADALRHAARDAGVEVCAGAAARAVAPDRVRTDGGEIEAEAVVLCVPPATAAALTGSAELARLAAQVVPVRAACLDVALRVVTEPSRRFALGVDRPLYVGTHSDVARELAPAGATLIHAAVYGGEGTREELEAALDALHPGWRDLVVFTRWMPDLVVSHDVPRAAAGGRRAPHEVDGVWLAGDWVGDEGMLADAAVASADAVAGALLARRPGREAA